MQSVYWLCQVLLVSHLVYLVWCLGHRYSSFHLTAHVTTRKISPSLCINKQHVSFHPPGRSRQPRTQAQHKQQADDIISHGIVVCWVPLAPASSRDGGFLCARTTTYSGQVTRLLPCQRHQKRRNRHPPEGTALIPISVLSSVKSTLYELTLSSSPLCPWSLGWAHFLRVSEEGGLNTRTILKLSKKETMEKWVHDAYLFLCGLRTNLSITWDLFKSVKSFGEPQAHQVSLF